LAGVLLRVGLAFATCMALVKSRPPALLPAESALLSARVWLGLLLD
jgi:hypothetical protein